MADIVDVFNDQQIGINIIQVLKQCTMTTWPEDKVSLFIPKRIIAAVSSDDIGGWLLNTV